MKHTHIDWCPLVPVHWQECLFKHCVNIYNGRDYKDIESSEGIPVIGSGGPFACCTETMYNGEVIFLGRKGTIDKPLYYNGPFWAVDTMFYAIPQKGYVARYLYYLATCFPFKKISTQTALPSMTQAALRGLKLFMPPFEEQKAIAEYLDKKTAEIDTQVSLLENKQKAYEKLKCSLIDKVVTCGLNPDVELKDSGIDWIGEIPVHWDVKRIKDIAELGTGTTPKSTNEKYYDDGIHPWLITADVQNRLVESNDNFITDLALTETPNLKLYPTKTVLLAMYGGGTIGNVGLMTYPAYINQACCAMIPKSDIFEKYLFYYLLTKQKRIISTGVGGTQINLSQSKISAYPISVPPFIEQKKIANYLDKKTAEIDTQIDVLNKKATTYKKLKQSLIDEVVTGKRKI